MTERNCGTCRHFVRIESAASGHCTNPLVVSHQGQLVMYRSGEIGCRRGWKQDLWEASDEASEPVAAASGFDVPVDYGRAAAWADSAPQRTTLHDNLLDSDLLDDEDLLDPRRTRDIREAMRRAREMKRRDQLSASRREPFDQPMLGAEPVSGEDSVVHVEPAPRESMNQPIVPPVSADEVRRRVDEMRQARRYNDPPPSIHFGQYDDHFSDRDESPIVPLLPEDSRLRSPRWSDRSDDRSVSVDGPSEHRTMAATPYEDVRDLEDLEPIDSPAVDARGFANESHLRNDSRFDFDTDEEAEWPEQAPWVEDVAYDDWQHERPKRRSWFGNLLHRQPRPQPIDRHDSAFAWEPELEEIDDFVADEPLAAEAAFERPVERPRYDDRQVPRAPAGAQLPPLPYKDEDELQDDYLLAEGRFGDAEEEDPQARQIDHICATCRYFRPDGTCGNAFAFTYRRRVSEEYLSCASSIGAWWLPSDHYWESVVSFTHHGQPTPLLERYEIQANSPETDDEVRTP